MKYEQFRDFWNCHIEKWYSVATIAVGDTNVSVNTLCSLKKDYTEIVFKKYEAIKNIIKESYFKNIRPEDKQSCHLSRYKRASVLTYAIIKCSPIEYYDEKEQPWIDPYFLKQRLAFYMAISSIIQDCPKEFIEEYKNKKISFYDFKSLGANECNVACEDDFLMSVYKDLLYSEIYDNYNVLTMANVYGLLTEKSSVLKFLRNSSENESI